MPPVRTARSRTAPVAPTTDRINLSAAAQLLGTTYARVLGLIATGAITGGRVGAEEVGRSGKWWASRASVLAYIARRDGEGV